MSQMTMMINSFISGTVMMACVIIGLFFYKFYHRNRDRLILIFAIAFWMMAFERVCLILIPAEYESRSFVFLIRMMAFLLITYGIIDKNKARN